jgi:hypothetical protein
MSVPIFDPEQQGAIREVLPAGAGDVRIEARDDDTSPGCERKYETGVEWGLRRLDQFAMWHREWAEQQGRSISFKDQREGWRRIAKGLQRELARRRGLELSGYGRKLRQMSEEVAGLIDDCDFMAEKNAYPRNSHRELIYTHLLDVWTRLGGKLYKTTRGPLVRYFKRVASLVLDKTPLSTHTIAEIVMREMKRQAGKPSRKRKPPHKK